MIARAPRRLPRALSLAAVLILVAVSVHAQDVPTMPEPPVDAEVLNRKIAEVEASTTLDEEVAGTLVDLYRRALTNLEKARVHQAAEEDFASAGANTPGELTRVREAISAGQGAAAEESLTVPADATLSELDQTLVAEKAALGKAEAHLDGLRERYAAETARPGTARERLAEARTERDLATEELGSPAPADELEEIGQARRWHLETRAYRLDSEIRMLDRELRSHAVRFELLEAQLDQAAHGVRLAMKRTRQLEEVISSRRSAGAEQARQEAAAMRQALEDRHAEIGELARGNIDLSDRLAQRVLDSQEASEGRDTARQEAMRIEDELNSTRSKLAIAGLNQALGQMLIEHKRRLPDIQTLRRQAKKRGQQAADVGLEQIQLVEERRALRDIDGYLADVASGLTADEADELYPELETLALNRRGLVQQLIDAGSRYLQVLGELEIAQRELIDVVNEYDDFLAKHLLWVRNTTTIKVDALGSFPDDIERLLSPPGWGGVMQDLLAALRGKPAFGVLLVVLLVLGAFRRRFLAKVDGTARYVGRIKNDSFTYSIHALMFTLLAAVPLPLILVVVGSAITSNAGAAGFSRAIAGGLTMVGVDLVVLQVLFDTCRDQGLAIKHCGLTPFGVGKLRRELRWFRIVFPVVRFPGETSVLLDTGGLLGGLGVVGSVAAALLLGVFLFRCLTPAGGILRDYLMQRRDSALSRTRPVWFSVLMAILPVLIVLWLLGYSYTADMLAVGFMYSIWLIVMLMFLHSLLVRWLMVSYKRLEYRAAVERLEAARAAREAAGEAHAAEGADLEVEEPEVDFAALGSNSRELIRTVVLFAGLFGLWLIWMPVLPALGILEDITLWTRTGVVDGNKVPLPVTAIDLVAAVFVGVVAGAMAKGMPPFVEFLLLRRTSVTAGVRYTVTTLLRYVIIAIGAILVSGMLGGNWSQIQWLVAALGVGIGFGLQEIVANFISGLIILFERPLRIGDIVTVGDTTGVVTRIKIRATTIRDWERRELLVPNREFITGRLLNWTFSDSLTRIVIPVGIAYGSDVAKALKLTEEVAREHKSVLEDPAPFVTCENFGDSSIILTLRAYLPSLDRRLSTASEIRASIKSKFEEAGVVIAFPQADIHLDTSKPLEVRMQTSTLEGFDPAG
jgi:potassium efflux system protein